MILWFGKIKGGVHQSVDKPSWWCRTFHWDRWTRGMDILDGSICASCPKCETHWVEDRRHLQQKEREA